MNFFCRKKKCPVLFYGNFLGKTEKRVSFYVTGIIIQRMEEISYTPSECEDVLNSVNDERFEKVKSKLIDRFPFMKDGIECEKPFPTPSILRPVEAIREYNQLRKFRRKRRLRVAFYCEGCMNKALGQRAHMGKGGCLNIKTIRK